jgi:hypothetical protein
MRLHHLQQQEHQKCPKIAKSNRQKMLQPKVKVSEVVAYIKKLLLSEMFAKISDLFFI